MTELIISQEEANRLIALKKRAENGDTYTFPDLGGSVNIPIISNDYKENFFLDVARGRINLVKGTNQIRSHQVVVLLRLDFNGPPHRNPDGEEIPCPHIHIYKEGFGDKWAYPAPADIFANINDGFQTLYDFMKYCNIEYFPNIRRGLFT
ncbi:DUF6978 family protein [Ciceribacter azotifigens]|uniref:DUF6978 family protein n=1 Tax=Ciceribacter azotifigens TaxID=2069303 RepID=UPI003A890FDA